MSYCSHRTTMINMFLNSEKCFLKEIRMLLCYHLFIANQKHDFTILSQNKIDHNV